MSFFDDGMSDHELIAIYKSIRRKERAGTSTRQDALDMIVVCGVLGSRDYHLTDDEPTWVRLPDQPGDT